MLESRNKRLVDLSIFDFQARQDYLSLSFKRIINNCVYRALEVTLIDAINHALVIPIQTIGVLI